MKYVGDIAVEWHAGRMPLESVRIQCTEPDRWTAIRFMEPHSARKAALMAMFDALIATEGALHPEKDPLSMKVVMTEHGALSMKDILDAGGRVMYDRNHHRVVQFPYDVINGIPQYRDIPDYVVDEHERSGER